MVAQYYCGSMNSSGFASGKPASGAMPPFLRQPCQIFNGPPPFFALRLRSHSSTPATSASAATPPPASSVDVFMPCSTGLSFLPRYFSLGRPAWPAARAAAASASGAAFGTGGGTCSAVCSTRTLSSSSSILLAMATLWESSTIHSLAAMRCGLTGHDAGTTSAKPAGKADDFVASWAVGGLAAPAMRGAARSEEHTSELQSHHD